MCVWSKNIILLLFVLGFHLCKAQDQHYVDSLQKVLKQVTGKEKVRTLITLSAAYRGVQVDSYLVYAAKTLEAAQNEDSASGYISEAHFHLGEAYHFNDEYKKALEHYHEALKLFPEEEVGKPSYVAVMNIIGLLYYRIEDYDRALEYYEGLLEYIDSTNYSAKATMYNNIGGVLYKKGKYNLAIQYFRQSISYREKANIPEEEFYSTYNNIATCYREQGQMVEALEYMNKAILLTKKAGNMGALATAYLNMAKIYMAMHRARLGLEYLKKSEATADSVGSRMKLLEAYVGLSEAYKEDKNFELALLYTNKAQAMRDSLQWEQSKQQMAEMENEFQVEKRELELEALRKEQALSKQVEEKQKRANILLAVGLCLALVLGLVVLAGFVRKRKDNLVIKRQKEEVEQQKVVVESQKEEILDSIKYARLLQDNTLPDIKPLTEHFSDHFILYKPKDIVSGDFYWVGEPAGKQGRWVVFGVGDCTGHGVPGALLTMMAQNYFRLALTNQDLNTAGQALGFIDEGFKELLNKEGGSGQNHGMDAALCAFNIDKNELYYAGARNPLVIIRNGEVIEYKGDKRGVGEKDSSGPFSDHKVEIQKGDALYMFSDGFIDQFGGEKGKKLKYKPFKELLVANYDNPMASQLELYNTFYENWKGNLEQLDDVCILGIRV